MIVQRKRPTLALGRMEPRLRSKLARALVAATGASGLVFASLAVAAERNPALEAVQAQCIQEGMLRGYSGEALKQYVNACTEVKRHAPPPDLKQFSADPGAC